MTKVTLESEEVEIAQKFERAVRSAWTQISYKLSAWTCLSVLRADLPVEFELDELTRLIYNDVKTISCYN